MYKTNVVAKYLAPFFSFFQIRFIHFVCKVQAAFLSFLFLNIKLLNLAKWKCFWKDSSQSRALNKKGRKCLLGNLVWEIERNIVKFFMMTSTYPYTFVFSGFTHLLALEGLEWRCQRGRRVHPELFLTINKVKETR